MDFGIEFNDVLRIVVSIICGSAIGFEREYRNKSAGFRTIILICLGSTIFTMVSQNAAGMSDDRIAANIITGVGFIGAGVIFKDNVSITGLTTAAVIWAAAAIGMVVGISEYGLGLLLSCVVLIILSVFNKIEGAIDFLHHRRTFNIKFKEPDVKVLEQTEQFIKAGGLSSKRLQIAKTDEALVVTIEIYGKKRLIQQINEKLVSHPDIRQINQTNASNSSILDR
ncbi:MAG TPA: MgtC/SapB family protein [Sphingobacteriaceae bacterium]